MFCDNYDGYMSSIDNISHDRNTTPLFELFHNKDHGRTLRLRCQTFVNKINHMDEFV